MKKNCKISDVEIRLWCLQATMSSEIDFEPHQFPNIEKAQELYNFIFPVVPRQKGQRKKPRGVCRLSLKSLLSRLRLRH